MCLAYYLAAPCKNALTHKKGTTVLRQCPSAYCKQLHRKLDRAEGRVDSQQDNTCARFILPLTRAGTVMMSMTASMTGRSSTRLELMPKSVEPCGMVNGASVTEHR